MKSVRELIVDYYIIVDNNNLYNYLTCFRYLDGDTPIVLVNTRTK